MKRILLIAALMGAAFWAGAQEPEKGDIGALLMSKFTEEEDAMRFVVRELMFPLNLVPETYDKDLGYLVTERFFYQGWLSCQFVFFFKTAGDGVAVKIIGRDYNMNKGEGMHQGPMKYAKGMKGSPVESYWNYLTHFAEHIPHTSLEYISE